jgi:hypothetical protein
MVSPLHVLVLGCALAVCNYGQTGGSYNRLRYLGGTIDARTSRFDWNTQLTHSEDMIEIRIEGKTKIQFKPEQITDVVHGPTAEDRVRQMASKSSTTTPIPLFGLLRRSLGWSAFAIFYRDNGGKSQALLFESDYGAWSIVSSLRHIAGIASTP